MIHLLLAIIYLAFVSLGLPDGLLGSAWPVLYEELEVPVSYAGIVFVLICAGTVVSSLFSDRLTRALGAGKVTALSVATTAVALFGFSISRSFWMLCLWAIPYGLGAGSVDAALNNYVALHFASRHMSWLHCMWGIGASTGPYIMGAVLTGGQHWSVGYGCIALLQLLLTMVLFFTLPLWKKNVEGEAKEAEQPQALSLKDIFRIPGAKEIMVAFFCYCALEQTTGLWVSSYLVFHKGMEQETAASFAGLFFLGITVGRALNGFLTVKLRDTQLIRLGMGIIAVGIVVMLLPTGSYLALAALVLIGLGCAPIYPCIIHSTPEHFGAHRSQAVIGVQMASAYLGNCIMPPVFGLIANHIHVAWLPAYLGIILVTMAVMYQRVVAQCESRPNQMKI